MKRLVDVYPYRYSGGEPEFFIARRSLDKQYAGQWRMIGGKVNDGETAWQAGLRELKEETGVNPARFWTVPSLNHFYAPTSDSIHLIPAFAAEIDRSGDIHLNEEHSEFKWITAGQISLFILWPEQARIIKLIHRILSSRNILEEWKIEIK